MLYVAAMLQLNMQEWANFQIKKNNKNLKEPSFICFQDEIDCGKNKRTRQQLV